MYNVMGSRYAIPSGQPSPFNTAFAPPASLNVMGSPNAIPTGEPSLFNSAFAPPSQQFNVMGSPNAIPSGEPSPFANALTPDNPYAPSPATGMGGADQNYGFPQQDGYPGVGFGGMGSTPRYTFAGAGAGTGFNADQPGASGGGPTGQDYYGGGFRPFGGAAGLGMFGGRVPGQGFPTQQQGSSVRGPGWQTEDAGLFPRNAMHPAIAAGQQSQFSY